MKRIEIVLNGTGREDTEQEIMRSIYGVLREHGCTELVVKSETLPDEEESKLPALVIPEFLKSYSGKRKCPQGTEGR